MTWLQRIDDVLACYYLAGLFCFLTFLYLSKHFKALWRSTLVAHGKVTTRTVRVRIWRVPKSLFTDFYALGLLFGAAILRLDAPQEVILLLHLARRYLETLSWPYSRYSTMHLLHALVGLSYYPVLVLSMVSAAHDFQVRPWHTAFIVLASLVQSYSHLELYRARGRKAPQYAPMSDRNPLFRLILCPHYLMEVVIYGIFAIASQGSFLMCLNFVFVAANLSITAQSTRTWYQDQFLRDQL